MRPRGWERPKVTSHAAGVRCPLMTQLDSLSRPQDMLDVTIYMSNFADIIRIRVRGFFPMSPDLRRFHG